MSPKITLSIRADHIPGEFSVHGEGVRNSEANDSGMGFPGSRVYETIIRSEEEIPGIVRRIVEAGGNIYSVAAQKPSLEEIYFALTEKGKEDVR